eukprot:352834-Chlamydomonas_euryale.AAC.1
MEVQMIAWGSPTSARQPALQYQPQSWKEPGATEANLPETSGLTTVSAGTRHESPHWLSLPDHEARRAGIIRRLDVSVVKRIFAKGRLGGARHQDGSVLMKGECTCSTSPTATSPAGWAGMVWGSTGPHRPSTGVVLTF